MRKQEHIHLHGLLAEIADHCTDEYGITIDTEAYQSLGVRPTSIHKAKGDHKDAVLELADSITTVLADEQAETIPASAD